ncbi:PREDICTED: uncharacterized protein LOC103339988 [Prunus mume]|uniref:Uncharacterized protein LOC103339988 n=1 Tax=Prunus mume TaxID=102107 RepID=A0ABM1LWS2_PRUMU|nr:PREDICTED: uncharacterized protein LOC103339988 [Prunus mume]
MTGQLFDWAGQNKSGAFTPLFPKVKNEAWWLVLANTSTWELYALIRVSFSDHLVTHMELPSVPKTLQIVIYGSSKSTLFHNLLNCSNQRKISYQSDTLDLRCIYSNIFTKYNCPAILLNIYLLLDVFE